MSTKQTQSQGVPSQESKRAPGAGPLDAPRQARPPDQKIDHNSHRQQQGTPRESKKDGNS